MKPLTIESSFAELRVAAGLTIADLKEIVGVSERTLYRWDSGEITPKKGILSLCATRPQKETASRR